MTGYIYKPKTSKTVRTDFNSAVNLWDVNRHSKVDWFSHMQWSDWRKPAMSDKVHNSNGTE